MLETPLVWGQNPKLKSTLEAHKNHAFFPLRSSSHGNDDESIGWSCTAEVGLAIIFVVFVQRYVSGARQGATSLFRRTLIQFKPCAG